ncbi:MAG: membrane protein insertase YidC [Deltaproteobacteria bacterium]|jgi:YidC/Oxa1 family membrane protein insertase|nr:membrane protein insertase YidC [Deltaproteobacteria bacterium]
MEQARLLIAIVLSALIFLLWQLFFVDKDAIQQSAKKTKQPPVKEEQVKESKPYSKEQEVAAADKTPDSGTEISAPVRIPRNITVDTPFYQAQLSEEGGGVTSFILKKYREKVAKDSPLQELIPRKDSIETVLLGFAGKSLPGLDNAVFSASLNADTVNIQDAAQEITFAWKSDEGVVVEKTYTFSPDSYLIGLDVTIKNGSDRSIQDKLFVALNSPAPTDKRMYGFEGPSALINEKLEEIKIKDITEKNTYTGKVTWIALQDRYFMMSVIPDQVEAEASMRLFLKEDNLLEAQYLNPAGDIRPGTQHTYQYSLFFGPKSMKILKKAGHDLGKALNFGWFTVLAKPCVWLMNRLYSVIPNYGIAIIILTLLIKIVLWPLGSKSYKSMSEMKKIQPLMKEIREKYKNDKKKMNEEVMGLYRTYKINPLGGCLPMVVQLPVFFALYRMLYQSIELRHAPFFLWIDDLSAPDRLFNFSFSIPFMEPPYGIPVLTIIMGATMLLQQKMSPPMGDPTQAKMMMFMPLIFTFIFINFSSGLVLYWLVNNILSISQQYYIQKKFA